MPRDYLLHLIDQVGQMLASVLAHKKAGRTVEAKQEIETTCLQMLGLSMSAVKRSSPEALLDLLRSGGGLRHSRGVLLAELLLQEAELCQVAGKMAEAVAARLQAFCLLSESVGCLGVDDAAIYAPKRAAVAEELARISEAPYVRDKLRAYGCGARTG